MQALVIGDLGLVPRLDERLEAELDQLRDAAAEHGLLAEEIGLRLLRERRLDHARARRAERRAVGERELARLAARVLRDRDDGRRAVALGVEAAHHMARALRRDHDHVVPLGRRDALVVHVEAVREEQRSAGLEVRLDLVLVHLRLRAVGNEKRDELRATHRVGERGDREAGLFRRRGRRAALSEPDDHVDA